jgi:general stress protein 26
MDSINRNQPEQNRRDLRAEAAVEKIRELVDRAENCFFCTSDSTGGPDHARPMNVRQVDDHGCLWFLSPRDSNTNQDVAVDPAVRLYFQGSRHSDFLQLDGLATVSTDRAKIEELWEPIIRTWFTEGVDDPRITVIRVEPTEGYYWDTKHGNAVAGVKVMIGSLIGKTLDDSIEGKLDP